MSDPADPADLPLGTIKSALISMLTSRKFVTAMTRRPTQNVLVARYLVLSFRDRDDRPAAPPDPPEISGASAVER